MPKRKDTVNNDIDFISELDRLIIRTGEENESMSRLRALTSIEEAKALAAEMVADGLICEDDAEKVLQKISEEMEH